MSTILPNLIIGNLGTGTPKSIARWKTISGIEDTNDFIDDNNQIGIGALPSVNVMLDINCSATNKTGLKIKAYSGQTADLFKVVSSDESCLFVINYQGDTGVTICSPNEPLHIQSDFDGNRGIRIGNESNGTAAVGRFIVDVLGGSTFLAGYGSNFTTVGSRRANSGSLIANANMSGGLSLVARHSTTGHLRFYSGGNEDANERMIIMADGKIGIGNNSPNSILDVEGDIYPHTDNTYYLGKNDDDIPFAWKGLILKDTTNGKYYRIEVINGTITATDLTD